MVEINSGMVEHRGPSKPGCVGFGDFPRRGFMLLFHIADSQAFPLPGGLWKHIVFNSHQVDCHHLHADSSTSGFTEGFQGFFIKRWALDLKEYPMTSLHHPGCLG